MKKILLLSLGFFLFTCCISNKQQTADNKQSNNEQTDTELQAADSEQQTAVIEQTDTEQQTSDKHLSREELVLKKIKEVYPQENCSKYQVSIEKCICGDFDGDGQIDSVYNYFADYKPEFKEEEEYHEIFSTYSGISSNNPSIPGFKPDKLPYYGCLTNEGDLDGNGADDLGFFPSSLSSFCSYKIYSLRNGSWIEIASADVKLDMLEEKEMEIGGRLKLIKPDPKKPGNVLIKFVNYKDPDLFWDEKSVKLK